MEAKDLRAGNKVFYGGVIVAVTTDFLYYEKWNEAHCKPIPLSPEILERCGFVEDNYGTYHIPILQDQLLWIKFYKGDFKQGWSCSIDFGEDMKALPDCNSLHDLMNLYYALTKTELNYTP